MGGDLSGTGGPWRGGEAWGACFVSFRQRSAAQCSGGPVSADRCRSALAPAFAFEVSVSTEPTRFGEAVCGRSVGRSGGVYHFYRVAFAVVFFISNIGVRTYVRAQASKRGRGGEAEAKAEAKRL